ncbi:MAG: hypothetical protein CL561_04280 [Alphaproteobacteria bacterium]|nr:hypothetical protein [Alphaproteobacteria bacterium]|tara:strand:- start:4489 stop:5049 length:561 start_codon:yes stop_codon:yes gene_type:complete
MIGEEQKAFYKNWNTLAAAAQAGDKRAYSTLIEQLIPFARSVLAGKLAELDWIDDVVQDALISAHKALPTYQVGRSFKAWFTAILYYRKTDYLRKVYARKNHQTSSFDELIEKNMDPDVTIPTHIAEYDHVEKLLEQIPQKQRDLFILARIEGYTAKEVANMKNMSESAVKVSVHRTSKKLKELLS